MAPARTEAQDEIVVAIKQVPITEKRKPYVGKDSEDNFKDAGTPRANIAATPEAPNGTLKGDWAKRYQHQTVLQQHIAFFDPDKDGIIWPLDTYTAFRRLGYNLILSIIATLIINLNFSYPSLPTWIPDPLFRIHIANIHKDKHGSDSGTYDHEGRFVPQNFENIFEKYATGNKQSISLRELATYFWEQKVLFDFFGWGGALFEWIATYLLLWPADGRMQKDDIRRVYDGSIFYEIAARREKKLQQ